MTDEAVASLVGWLFALVLGGILYIAILMIEHRMGKIQAHIARQTKIMMAAQMVLPGQTGVAITRIRALQLGQVKLLGEVWDAYSAVDVRVGDPVVIDSLNGLTLVVRPESSPAAKTRAA